MTFCTVQTICTRSRSHTSRVEASTKPVMQRLFYRSSYDAMLSLRSRMQIGAFDCGRYYIAASGTSAAASTQAGAFNTAVLQFLVCPLTKGELRYDAGKQELISTEINVAYPIIDGIPRLTPTSGRVMDDNEPTSAE